MFTFETRVSSLAQARLGYTNLSILTPDKVASTHESQPPFGHVFERRRAGARNFLYVFICKLLSREFFKHLFREIVKALFSHPAIIRFRR